MSTGQTHTEASIEADQQVPMIHVWRDFRATPAQLYRAHTEPELFSRWIGPADIDTRIEEWECRDGGHWSYRASRADFETGFRGCFHTVREDRIVQTFTWEGLPDQVALETLTFADLGDGITRLHAKSLCDSFEARDAWLSSGMGEGVNDGYAELDRMLESGDL